MFTKVLFLLLLPLIAFSMLSQKTSAEEKAITIKQITDVPEEELINLSNRKIFFGHQSVGDNIISGLQEILQQHPNIKLNFLEIKKEKPQPLSHPVFAHAKIGANLDPKLKIDDFVNVIEHGLGKSTDFAFMKFCYIDIHKGTDIKSLFSYYKNAMEKLAAAYPNTRFIHVTAPLTSRQTGIKAMIKKIIGKPLRGDNNPARAQFNQMMRAEYLGKQPLFDLACLEATKPADMPADCSNISLQNQELLPKYTDDGGHLNALGSKIIAEQLIIFLANLEHDN
jgi:hypothetical protein